MSKDKLPSFSARNEPQQSRAHKTVDAILQATAELIEESGFEQLSTNQICKRASLTPPALYRYFPNKYAVMRELGERLFKAQRDILIVWEKELAEVSVQPADIERLLRRILAETYKQPAGAWIMRSLHASPYLVELRLESLRALSAFLKDRVVRWHPHLNETETYIRMRLAVESGYSIIELIFDEPGLDANQTIHLASENLSSFWRAGLGGL